MIFETHPRLVKEIRIDYAPDDQYTSEVPGPFVLDKDIHGYNDIFPQGWPLLGKFSLATTLIFYDAELKLEGDIVDVDGTIPSDYRGQIRFTDPSIELISNLMLKSINSREGKTIIPHISDRYLDQDLRGNVELAQLAVAGALGYKPGLHILSDENDHEYQL
jgi:hypothetical protein